MTKLLISLLLITLCVSVTLQQDVDAYPGAVGLFPWFAFYQREHGTWRSDACGGTIIAKNWIITTANCGSPANNTIYRILLGAVEWEDEENAEQIIETTLFYRHPLFHDHAGNRTNNVGLMELPTDIQFSPRIQAINLPWDYRDISFAGQDLFIVAALNQINENGFNHNLRFNQLRVITDYECDVLSLGFRNEPEMCTFVTESNPLQTPCGPSPGTALATNQNGYWIMIGSGADSNCGNTSPTRWNRLTEHLEWIEEVTGLTENL